MSLPRRFVEEILPASFGGLYLRRIAGLAAVYVVSAGLGLVLAHHHEHVSMIWAPTGFSLAALILFGRALWPGVFVGAVVVTLWTGGEPLLALGIATGSSLEAWLGAFILVRFADFRPTLERVQDVASFVLVGALGCTLVSPTVGVASLWLAGNLEPGHAYVVWLVWWLGDVGGAIVATPILLMIERGDPAWPVLFHRSEYWFVLLLGVAVTVFAFSGVAANPGTTVTAYLPLPLLVWAGSRLGSRGVVTCASAILAIAAVGTGVGLGPFAAPDVQTSLVALWGYGMVMGTTALMLAAAIAQREHMERRLEVESVERRRREREATLHRERERMVREMHDGIGGLLVTALSMFQRGRATRDDLADTLRNVLDDLRLLIDSLDPVTPDLESALGKVRARLEQPLRRGGIELRWHLAADCSRVELPTEHVLHVVRIVQEAVTNAIRHARPARLEVDVSVPTDGSTALRVLVRDNGRGVSEGEMRPGHGLRNMTKRAAEMDAALRIASGAGGTEIELLLPPGGPRLASEAP